MTLVGRFLVIVGVIHIGIALQIPCDNFLEQDVPIENLRDRSFRFSVSPLNSCYHRTEIENPGLFNTTRPGMIVGEIVGDDVSIEANLPFNFPFFGYEFSSVFIGSNGFLTFFAAETDFDTKVDEFHERAGIFPFTRDLNPANGMGLNFNGSIFYTQLSENSYGIQYYEVPVYQFEGINTFQVVLESSGDFTISYGFINFSPFIYGVSSGIINVTELCYPEQVNGEFAGLIVEEERGDDPFVCFDNVLSSSYTDEPKSYAPHWIVDPFLAPFEVSDTNFAKNNNSGSFVFQVCGGSYEFQFSVCGEDGGSFFGDTALRLFRNNVEGGGGRTEDDIMYNDDGCVDGSVGSKLTYNFDVPCEQCQYFTLLQGCYENQECGGTVAFTALRSYPTEECPSWLPDYELQPFEIPAAGDTGVTAGDGDVEDGVREVEQYVDYDFTVCGGTHTLIFATCDLPGARHGGNTKLQLLDKDEKIVDIDTECPNGGGSVINHAFTVACGQCQNFTLRQGCEDTAGCNGTVGFVPISLNYQNAEQAPDWKVCSTDCEGNEIYNVSYNECHFTSTGSSTPEDAGSDCFYNTSSNEMCYRPTESGVYISYFLMTDSHGESSTAMQQVESEGKVGDGICLWQNGCAGDPRGCEEGAVCREYRWWSQCQEDPEVPREWKNGKMCYATNNGPMPGQRWGCNEDSDCCNDGATCGKDRLCHLPCRAREVASWSEEAETEQWWEFTSMGSEVEVLITLIFSVVALLLIVGAGVYWFSKQHKMDASMNVVLEYGMDPLNSFSMDTNDDSISGYQDDTSTVVGDIFLSPEDQI